MTEDAPQSQTLSRGIRLLEQLAESDGPLTMAELCERCGLHRSIAYRLLRTLEDHRLVTRTDAGAFRLGPGLSVLARGVARDLQAAAGPELAAIASELEMTAFAVVLDHGAVITVASVEPPAAHAAVAQRPGSQHLLAIGAPGLAVQSLLDRERLRDALGGEPRPELETVRARGYAASHGEVIPGLSSIAVPLRAAGHPPAALAVVYLSSPITPASIARRLADAAAAVSARLG